MSEEEIPPLPSSELLVKVRLASINPVDIQLWRSGLVGVVAGDKGMGRDFSGTVIAVGSKVNGWKEGDDIFGLLFHVVGLSSRYFVLGSFFCLHLLTRRSRYFRFCLKKERIYQFQNG